MKDLIERNYKSIIKRNLINENTRESDFIIKLQEEVKEFIEANNYNLPNEMDEVADIILVCLNYARHYNVDIEQVLKEKITFNENR